MAQHLRTGATGEQVACQHLLDRGYVLLHRNWRSGHDELDLVMRDGDELVVVEVKTRSTAGHGDPEEAVGRAKQRKLQRAAEAYLEVQELDLDLRFDVVSVVLDDQRPEVFHILDAFAHTPEEDETIEE